MQKVRSFFYYYFFELLLELLFNLLILSLTVLFLYRYIKFLLGKVALYLYLC